MKPQSSHVTPKRNFTITDKLIQKVAHRLQKNDSPWYQRDRVELYRLINRGYDRDFAASVVETAEGRL